METGVIHRHAPLAAVALAVSGLLAGSGCKGRPRHTVPDRSIPSSSAVSSGWRSEDPDPYGAHVAELDLSHGLPESGLSGWLGTPSRRTFADATRLLHDLQAGKEKQVKGLLVLLGTMTTGFSRAQEVGEALAAVRASGTPVVCHADGLSNASYWLAARGCDRIWVSPAGTVETVGLATQVVYVRRMLGELHVDVDVLQVGRFKGTQELLTRDGPSDEARASMVGMLASIRASWLDAVSKGRPGKQLGEALESGPWAPKEALDRGLIDAVGYDTDARADARARTGVQNVVTRFGPRSRGSEAPGLVSVVRLLSGAGEGGSSPHVAVVRASGSISMESASLLGDGDGISHASLSRTLEKIRDDDSVRSVVLRIDSPGGSALASDLLWTELMALRSVKPLVVSVGDMAASGGYYMACAGTRVFAQPSSIVGSIGVVGGKLSFRRSLDRVGVSSEVIAASSADGAAARAAFESPLDPWDDATRQRMLSVMTDVYELFVSRVAQGRGLSADKVAAFAEGRLHAGREGLSLGMIDEFGGLQEAIAFARKAGGLEPDAPAYLVGEDSGLERVLGLDDDAAQQGPSGRALARLAVSAIAPDLASFARAFEPMLHGEHTLVAVPFAFLVR